MPIILLNDRRVATLKPADKRIDYFDAKLPGFMLRVTPSGARTFALMYRANGRLRRLTIGRFDKNRLGLKTARNLARKHLLSLEVGRDPADDVKLAKSHTWQNLCVEYIEKYAKPKKKSWRDDQVMITNELQRWNDRPASGIRRSDVRELLDAIVARGAGVRANRVLSLVRKVFNFGIDREWLEVNPAQRMARPATETSRDRVLSLAELCILWAWLHAPAPKSKRKETTAERERRIYHPLNRAALTLRLLTAQRGSEVIGIKWSEVTQDASGAWWTIPAERSKNGLSHRVPLTALAVEALDRLRAARRPEQVFKGIIGTRQRHGALDGLSLANVVPHDLRRTAASHMASAKVPRDVIGKVLNHVETGVTAVYDRHSYDAEKRDALNAWERILREQVIGVEVSRLA